VANTHASIGAIPSTTSPVLGEMVRRLVEVYRPEKIYLFGSVARGEATADSDYDLMIVVPDTSISTLKQNRAGYRALREIGVPRDIFVSTSSDFNKQLHLKASFPSTVVREGLLLYGR
jgi:predicted nucleotidyltransferase